MLAVLAAGWVQAAISVRDDTGRMVELPAPARRIISLSPHITENLFSAGAGNFIVGVSDYSDFPAPAKQLPHVGSYASLDLESILAKKPDLVIAWESGNAAAHLAKLRALGLPLFISQPNRIDDIASTIERFGELAGTGDTARAAANAFRTRHAAMRNRHASLPTVRVFYQIWNQPLATVNGDHLISDVLRLCGAENVFARLAPIAPTVTLEAVLAANPEAIVASGMDESRPEWLDMWKPWRELAANIRGNLFFVPPDLINRPTLRLLDGAQIVCKQMETARSRRK